MKKMQDQLEVIKEKIKSYGLNRENMRDLKKWNLNDRYKWGVCNRKKLTNIRVIYNLQKIMYIIQI